VPEEELGWGPLILIMVISGLVVLIVDTFFEGMIPFLIAGLILTLVFLFGWLLYIIFFDK
jgi:hypothetical protein